LHFHPADKKALSLLAIFAIAGQLLLSAVCCAQGDALTQTVTAGNLSYVIICTPAGTQRVPLADYLAGQRTGEPTGESSSIFGCAHCSLCGMTALTVAALLLTLIAWATPQATRAQTLSAIRVRRSFSARAPPAALPL
jgi:hypothetical protein